MTRFDLLIKETLKKVLSVRRESIYHFNQQLMAKRATKFARQARSKIQYLEFDGVILFD